MKSLHQDFREKSAEIGHVKAVVESGGKQRIANLTSLAGQISMFDESPLSGTEARMILNARVQMSAAALETVARRAIAGLSGQEVKASITAFRCLTPGRPRPTYRYHSL